ncbi:MAG: hypothetical protein J7L45_00765 [Candidatus Aenigmarchaeota archaeon]|nr:hypothetical protein [Candidatus Aenigmarchaeota archaeon]
METVTAIGMNLWYSFLNAVPGIIAAIILLIIGFIVGKVVGRIVREILVRVGVDKYLHKREHLKFQASSVLDTIARWLIYLAFIQAAVSVLNIDTLTFLMTEVMTFIANIAVAIVIIIVAYGIGIYTKDHIIGKGTSYSDITGKIVIYFITFVGLALGLNIVFPGRTDLINGILLLIVGGVSLGAAIALGLGLKDVIREMAKDYAKEFRKKRK